MHIVIHFLNLRPSFNYLPNPGWLSNFDKDADWVVHLWFKNFLFTYEEEFLVCDWTCLLGEIGGNLGFFLGGSILAYIDLLLNPVFQMF